MGFDNAFIFRYSPRRDTPAAAMAEQVPEETKELRNQDLLSVINRHARTKLDAYVGRRVEILCEGPSKTNPSALPAEPGQQDRRLRRFAAPYRRDFRRPDCLRFASTLYGDPVLLALLNAPPRKSPIFLAFHGRRLPAACDHVAR